jgi:hypothetical protein
LNPATGSGELTGASHVRVTLCAATTPVPVRLIASDGFDAELLTTVSCPLCAPDAEGAKATLTTTLWPGVSVTGKVTPETENPVPVTLTEVTVTASDPVEARVTDCVELVLIGTLPKHTLVAFTVSMGADG